MSGSASYIGGIFGLLGVLVGALITQGTAWWQKRMRHRTYWSTMSAEADLCRELAQSYVNDGVAAPLYRFPTTAYQNGFPALLADGVVTNNEAKAVLAFYGLVEQLNRGLDQAHTADHDPRFGDAWLQAEARRLALKAGHLIEPTNGEYVRLRATIDERRQRRAIAP